MKIKFLLIPLVYVAFNGGPMNAQEPYDLNKCIITGIENNYSIIIAVNRENVSNNNATWGNAGLLPSVDLSGRYGGTVNSTYQNLTDGGENSSQGIHNSNATANMSVEWTIFRGYSARTSLKKLNELKSVGELNTRLAMENLVSNISAEYYYYIQQKQLYNNLRFAVDLSRERVRIDEERYLLGAGSKLQLLQSKVYFNSDSSRLARQSEVLRESEIRLNQLMAVKELDQSPVISDSLLDIRGDLRYEDLLNLVISNNTSLLIARKNKIISDYDYKIITARTYPYVSASSGYNYSFNNYEASSISTQHTRGVNYNINVGINIFDGFNRRREKSNAIIESENVSLRYLQIEQEVIGDLLALYSGYTNNLRLLELEEQNLATASENLEIAFERYMLGNLSGLDLREVQKSLLDAEERLLSVQYQVKSAEISLLLISGQITDYL
ncbi:MAG: TolC family protein [Bacteroidales bacterium]|nr:TolC family protein [Bacteroidales bacterium]